MNKEFFLIIAKRFAKGLLAVGAAFSVQFLIGELPGIQAVLPSLVHSPYVVALLSAGLLAIEKWLQGYVVDKTV